MNRMELCEAVAANVKDGDIVSKAACERIVNAVFDTIKNEVASGNEVSIVGFGTFKVGDQAARTGVNPATGEKINIPAKKAPKFKAGKAFKEAVNK